MSERIQLSIGDRTLKPTRRTEQLIELIIMNENRIHALHSGKVIFDIKGRKVVLSLEQSIAVSHPGGTVQEGTLDKSREKPLRSL